MRGNLEEYIFDKPEYSESESKSDSEFEESILERTKMRRQKGPMHKIKKDKDLKYQQQINYQIL